ncbi:MAG: nucleotidyltransferase family protein [Candidatus Hydrothermarchaeota archaeon]
MKCLILAGGFAQRMKLAKPTPKTLLRVGGKPVLFHILEKIPEDIEVIVSTNKRFEDIFNRALKDKDVKLLIEDFFEEKDKLGAVSAIYYAIETLGIEEDLLVIGGDNLFEFSLEDFISAYKGEPLVAVHDVKDLKEAKKYGEVKLEGNKIINVVEKPKDPSSSLISIACYIFPKDVFPILKEYCRERRDNLGEFISYLVERRDVYAYIFEEYWTDIGSIETYKQAKDYFEK